MSLCFKLCKDKLTCLKVIKAVVSEPSLSQPNKFLICIVGPPLISTCVCIRKCKTGFTRESWNFPELRLRDS